MCFYAYEGYVDLDLRCVCVWIYSMNVYVDLGLSSYVDLLRGSLFGSRLR
jgi:hypothetical protein